MDFRDYLPGKAPPWLQGDKGASCLRASGDTKDELVERAKQAVKARFPSLAPYDALAKLGADRQVERAPADTRASYATRVEGAWDTWPWAGTACGLLQALWDVGYTQDVYVEIVGGRQYHLDANRTLAIKTLPAGSWACDATPGFWSKFDLLFTNSPFADVPADDDPRIEQIRRLVRTWKSAHATCGGIYVCTSGETWGFRPCNPVSGGDAGTWGDSGVWGGTVVRYAP